MDFIMDLSPMFLLTVDRLNAGTMSLDYSVRSHQHIRRDRQADLLRRFQIDDELKLHRLLHRDIRGLGAFQNLVDESGGAASKSFWFTP